MWPADVQVTVSYFPDKSATISPTRKRWETWLALAGSAYQEPDSVQGTTDALSDHELMLPQTLLE